MTGVVVKVPGPRYGRGLSRPHSGTSAIHVLVLGEITEDPADREWWIEHPDSCPTFCRWFPEGVSYWGEGEDACRGPVEYGCPVSWEIDGAALDGLCDERGVGWWEPHGRGLRMTLPAGRYLVEAWWHDGHGAGEYGGQGDGDATFTLLGPETPLALTYPPDLLRPRR